MNMELGIDGMTCDHCVRAVEKALAAVPGVTRAEVSLAEGRATVEGDAEPGALEAAVEDEGYSVRKV